MYSSIASPSRYHSPIMLSVTLLASLACGDPQSGVNDSTERDSTGIAIVDNKSPLLSGDRAWTVDTTPIVRVDGVRFPLQRVVSAFRLTDGRIVVADGESMLLLVFDKTGARADTLGSGGDGPREFRYLYRAFPWRADSILVSDGYRDYLAILPVNGGSWRQLRIEEKLMVVNGVFSSGTLLMVPGAEMSLMSDGTEKQWVTSAEFHLATSQGKSKRKIGPFPTGIAFTSPTTIGTLVFGPTGYAEVGGTGLFVAYSQEYSIKIFNDDNVLTRIIRRSWTPSAVNPTHIEQWKQRMMAGLDGSKADEMRVEVNGARFAEQFPAHAEIQSDRLGNLWVNEYRPEHELPLWRVHWATTGATAWSVFDTSGRWITDVVLPPRFHPTDIGDDYIVGVSTDDDDVEQVRVLALRKGGSK